MNVHNHAVDGEAGILARAISKLEHLISVGSQRSSEDLAAVANSLRNISLDGPYPTFSKQYPHDFKVCRAYRDGLPDIQNGPAGLIGGWDLTIQHVGISNFRLPIRFRTREGGTEKLRTSVSGTVSLLAGLKGINMSRIMRTFYEYAETEFSFEVMDGVIDAYKSNLGSVDARLQMSFEFPNLVKSLRSGLTGYQYYDVTLEVSETGGRRTRIMHIDYVYSSTCPCSLELSEDARKRRGQLATPHSQRSVARISLVVNSEAECLWFEDIIDLCRRAVPTETQVMVKREDEQAFAELNAANPIFVEDAARLFSDQLKSDTRVKDFRVVASHQESLHSHDAVSILTQGSTFAMESIDPMLFKSMYHIG